MRNHRLSWVGLAAGLGLALLAVGCEKPAETAAEPTGMDATAPPAPAVDGATPADADGKPKLTVFVPCGMIASFRKLQHDYEPRAGVDMDITFDNGVVLLRKIRAGERPDVLISPGRLEMEMMETEGFVDPAATQTFGTFKMIVVVPKENKGGVQSWEDLTKPEVTSIAIAEPSQNSVGYYAKEALESLKIYDQVKSKLRENWHAKTAVDWICRGRVDAGIYYDSCPFESGPEKLEGDSSTYHVVGELPEGSYPKVEVQAGRLKEAAHPEAGDAFINYLVGEDGMKVLKESGIPPFHGEAPAAEGDSTS